MSTFYAQLKKTGLPDYAMPRLVRITKEYDPFPLPRLLNRMSMLMIDERIEANATFKKSKIDLVKKSWIADKNGNTDKLYWLDGKSYKSLDEISWKGIESGKAKL